MRVGVFWFGRRGSDPFQRTVAEYVERVSRRWPAEDVVLKPAAGGRDNDPGRAVDREWQVARRRIPDRWRIVALDESGRHVSSEGFSEELQRSEKHQPGVAFIVGSDLGLATECLRGADEVLALSRLTLPHRVARLLVWEQLFRSVSLLEGTPYHRPKLG